MVEEEAVLGAGVVLTSSTAIVDVTGDEPREMLAERTFFSKATVTITGS